ncbi:hypothetical protein [Parafilimonas terrae]|uniref:Uncharacterized protein n=1 Tax=Parafilimonas terrae TaxID=1465490 RepID=A0A1I5VRE3_9BACT|nr:hypothetical protein [Parafilimonas terrae]SFQ10011.1 hypothetical protein SAMN05444277_105142 [Parafilimonas terrae]
MPKQPAIPCESHVFINFPFDEEYKPLYKALIFAIHDCGFVARCALETIGAEEVRLNKLFRIINECQYGIHDISRVELGMKNNLPRFNMPFEAGIFWGCLQYGNRRQKVKRIMIIDSIAARYKDSLSDISGQDIKIHKDEPEELIKIVRSWLGNKTNKILPGGTEMWKHYQEFEAALPTICKNLFITLEEIISDDYFSTYIKVIADWLREKKYSM